MFRLVFNEVWKPVVGYEGYYVVSNYGRIRSLKTGVIMHQYKQRKGYLSVSLCKNGTLKTYKVHRLVALAFPEICGKWFEGATVNHKDENKQNNNASNLEWLSLKDNVNYGTGKYRRGSTQGLQKQKPVLVIDYKTGKELYKCESISKAADKTGANIAQISSILHNKYGCHSAKGYTFSFC